MLVALTGSHTGSGLLTSGNTSAVRSGGTQLGGGVCAGVAVRAEGEPECVWQGTVCAKALGSEKGSE